MVAHLRGWANMDGLKIKLGGVKMYKIILFFTAALIFAGCAGRPIVGYYHGQPVRECITDYECEQVNGF
jgi:hypothetical protein